MSNRTKSPLHAPAAHESGHGHVTGRALYIDDMLPPRGMLVGHLVTSPMAHGRISKLDVSAARRVAGVEAVLIASDIPGENQIGPLIHDEVLLAADEVFCVGQPIVLIIGASLAACRAAEAAVVLELEELPAILTVEEAVEAGAFHCDPHVIQRGDVDAALAAAALRFSGVHTSPGQDHFYLETHVALVIPGEHDSFMVYSSNQHPSEAQAKVAEVLGLGRHQVVVECPRMGGAFGGKESQGAHFAAFAAFGAWATGRPVKVWINRDQDMVMTGKRHPFTSRYEAGFDADGHLIAWRVTSYSDGGWSNDLSRAILDRCLFHLDNAYFIPNLRFEGRIAKTNTPSNTAFRGFGGPQGMVVVEAAMNRAARALGMDPAEIRRRNYYGDAPRNLAPYGQEITDCRLARIHDELLASSDYAARRQAIDAFNTSSPWIKRGIGLQPVKFGISFTAAVLNQAGALVHIYADGSVQLSHGGTEMGQGLHTKMLTVCAHELGVPIERVRVMHTSTDKVPNTSPTAASSGSDLNGQAVLAACRTLIARLRPVAAEVLGVAPERAADIAFADGLVYIPGDHAETTFAAVAGRAYGNQISLSSTGYYRTPGIRYDHATGSGKPFHYYAYGAAVIEVEVHGLTGEHRVLRADILHDVGDSLIPTIDKGQVEGAFIQGLGWVTCEELIWDRGTLKTHSPDTYKIPSLGNTPLDFRVALLDKATQDGVIHGSKAVGEPPFMLAIGALTALEHAIGAFARTPGEVVLRHPATAEAVLRAIDAVQQPTQARAADSEARAG